MPINLHIREREDQVECHTCGWKYEPQKPPSTRLAHKRNQGAAKRHRTRYPTHEVHWRTEVLRIY